MQAPPSAIALFTAAIAATTSAATTATAASALVPVAIPSPTQGPRPMTPTAAAQAIASLIPATHHEVGRRAVRVDGVAAELIRHERRDGRNAGLDGEHFSAVVAADGTLKGFAHIALELAGRPLPSRERTEAIARAFLQGHAPDLLPRMRISWIEAHDEPIRVQHAGRSETVTLTGMKVKARNLADGRWFWVIVGADERPMVFERDIVWISFPGHRQTEKWLHDAWLRQQGQILEQSV